jgi:hypothetical protein
MPSLHNVDLCREFASVEPLKINTLGTAHSRLIYKGCYIYGALIFRETKAKDLQSNTPPKTPPPRHNQQLNILQEHHPRQDTRNLLATARRGFAGIHLFPPADEKQD